MSLTDEEMRAWAEQVIEALAACGMRRATARPISRGRLALDVLCPRWVRGTRAVLTLHSSATFTWTGPQASIAEMQKHLDLLVPRWKVPPCGGPPWAVVLTEKNGYEGESWSFAMPIEHEQAALSLVSIAMSTPGRDVRVTPFGPRSLATFGSWSIRLGYTLATAAQERAASSRVGYMAYNNWSEAAGAGLTALMDRAAERGTLCWRASKGAGISMWKGVVRLHDAKDAEVCGVDLTKP
jgi:hypothetical protein